MPELVQEIQTYLDLALRRAMPFREAESVPPSMRVGEVDTGGCVTWRPVPSEVSTEDLAQLETVIGAPLSPAYRALLLDRHYVELACVVVNFDGHCVRSWLSDLEKRLRNHGVPGLVPIGYDAWDAGPIYLDLRHPDADGDGPVICHDMGWFGTEHEWRPFFSTSRHMFCALSAVLSRPPDHFPWYHRGEPNAEQRSGKAECLRAFFDADPAGAGGPGRERFAGLAEAAG